MSDKHVTFIVVDDAPSDQVRPYVDDLSTANKRLQFFDHQPNSFENEVEALKSTDKAESES